jgi:hypothetical protein
MERLITGTVSHDDLVVEISQSDWQALSLGDMIEINGVRARIKSKACGQLDPDVPQRDCWVVTFGRAGLQVTLGIPGA